MPYKDPERKRQWEREHREQRNAKRRMRHSGKRATSIAPNPAPDWIRNQEAKGDWKAILGLAVGFGVVLLAALGGIDPPLQSGTDRQSSNE